MRILILTTLLFLSSYTFAQITIEEARAKTVGSVVTVSGVVTNGDELGVIRYIQDSTAGIGVYDNDLPELNRGDSITVTGELDDFNNLLEITSVSDLIVHVSGIDLPEPVIVGISEIGEDLEGMLVLIEDIQMSDPGGTFSGNENYDFTDGTDTGELRISSSSSIVGQPIPSGNFNLLAICSQYSRDPNDTQSGYQLLPRTMDDLILGSSVNFTSPVEVVSLSKNWIILGWQTDAGATPFVRYGTSSATDSLTNIKQGDSTTSDEINAHIVEITNLEAAEIIYAQVFMVAENDTIFGSVGTYITESNSTGQIKVFFNTNVDESLASETTAKDIGNFMADTLAAYIEQAEESLDIAIYNFDNDIVKNAINAAHDRGVTVRIITCESTDHNSVFELNEAIAVLERPDISEGGIMHNKFVIIDAENNDPAKPWIWSGSTNLTSSQLFSDANNMIFIQDQSLAKAYEIEFEEMWGSTDLVPNSNAAKFGEEKTDNTPHEFMIGGNRIESYFSPSDNTNQKLIDAMGTSENDLYVETMLITRSDLAAAITDAHNRGANTHVITNSESDNASFVNDALNSTLPAGKFVTDNLAGGIMHHKLAIIDAYKIDSDPQVITGSHNWSNSANDRNDENTLIIHSADIANQYIQQFAYRFEQNNGNLVVSATELELLNLSIYPNPTEGVVYLNSASEIQNVALYNLQGAKLRSWNTLNSNTASIEISGNLSGIFLLHVGLKNGETAVYKIVKR